MIARALSGKRACGETRSEASVYAEFGFGSGGAPLEEYLFDPPMRVDQAFGPDFQLPNRGVVVVERKGVAHIVDRVGSGNYPDPAFYLEEVRHLGLSRKVPRNLDFARFTTKSLDLLVHDLGWIQNWTDWVLGSCSTCKGAEDVIQAWGCPKKLASHSPANFRDEAALGPDGGHPCSGLWWENSQWVPPGKSRKDVDKQREQGIREHTVTLPCGKTYPARWSPAAAKLSEFHPALIARFPISCFCLVQARDGSHADLREALSGCSVPVAESAT